MRFEAVKKVIKSLNTQYDVYRSQANANHRSDIFVTSHRSYISNTRRGSVKQQLSTRWKDAKFCFDGSLQDGTEKINAAFLPQRPKDTERNFKFFVKFPLDSTEVDKSESWLSNIKYFLLRCTLWMMSYLSDCTKWSDG